MVYLFSACLVFASAPSQGQSLLESTLSGEPSLYVEEVGTGDTVIVVLHGGPGISHDYLRPEWDRLANNGRRVVYYDQRGCGRSGDAAPYTWQADLADLRRVIQHVSPGAQVVLAGSSWGSWLAMLYAMEHAEDVGNLILSGTPPWWHKPLNSYSERLVRGIRRSYDRQREGRSERQSLALRADSINQGLVSIRRVRLDTTAALTIVPREDSLMAIRFTGSRQLVCRDAHAARVPNWRDIVPIDSLVGIRVPTLLIWGSEDRMLSGNARDIASHIPLSSVHIMEGVGHDPWFEDPQSFVEIVEDFLAN